MLQYFVTTYYSKLANFLKQKRNLPHVQGKDLLLNNINAQVYALVRT